MANKKLEKMLEKMKRQKINSISEEMMSELSKAKLILPGILPKNISPEAMKQFIDSLYIYCRISDFWSHRRPTNR